MGLIAFEKLILSWYIQDAGDSGYSTYTRHSAPRVHNTKQHFPVTHNINTA